MAGTGTADTTYVYFEAGATTGVTPAYGALKLPNPGNPSIATQAGDTTLAINGLPPLVAVTLIPVAVAVPQAGAYTLQVAGLTNFPAGTAVYLRDALLGTRTLLTVGTTHAVELAGTSAPGRFAVELRTAVVSATTPSALASQVLIYPNPAHQRLHVQLLVGTGPATTTLFNALGQPVRTQAAPGGQAIMETVGLAVGVYILRVQTATATVTKRVTLE
ncbi:MAG: T9SS type A sorting domain-containing protein [Hymenobacter sp.]